MAFRLISLAFQAGEAIPAKYTADGQNISPPLTWLDSPTNAECYAIVCEDPDAPSGTFTHWVIFNLPGEFHEVAEGIEPKPTLPSGAVQGTNDFKKIGYGGPAPPAGKPHRYVFHVYALDAPLDLPSGATKTQTLNAMKGHILVDAQLIGLYGRPSK